MSVADEMLFLLAALQNRLFFLLLFSTMKLEESHISVLAVHSVLSALKYWLLPWLFLLFLHVVPFLQLLFLLWSPLLQVLEVLLMQTDLQSPVPVPPS